MASKKTFESVSPRDFERLRGKLSRWQGRTYSGNRFSVDTDYGVEIGVRYKPSERALRLRILDRPWYISEGRIWRELEKLRRHA